MKQMFLFYFLITTKVTVFAENPLKCHLAEILLILISVMRRLLAEKCISISSRVALSVAGRILCITIKLKLDEN